MTYLVKQKLFSFGDGFNVRDEIGRPRHEVEGKFLIRACNSYRSNIS